MHRPVRERARELGAAPACVSFLSVPFPGPHATEFRVRQVRSGGTPRLRSLPPLPRPTQHRGPQRSLVHPFLRLVRTTLVSPGQVDYDELNKLMLTQ